MFRLCSPCPENSDSRFTRTRRQNQEDWQTVPTNTRHRRRTRIIGKARFRRMLQWLVKAQCPTMRGTIRFMARGWISRRSIRVYGPTSRAWIMAMVRSRNRQRGEPRTRTVVAQNRGPATEITAITRSSMELRRFIKDPRVRWVTRRGRPRRQFLFLFTRSSNIFNNCYIPPSHRRTVSLFVFYLLLAATHKDTCN